MFKDVKRKIVSTVAAIGALAALQSTTPVGNLEEMVQRGFIITVFFGKPAPIIYVDFICFWNRPHLYNWLFTRFKAIKFFF